MTEEEYSDAWADLARWIVEMEAEFEETQPQMEPGE